MKYWWVNQNQTFLQETEGGYMWSPKTRSDGGRNTFYDNMARVSPGEIVFSFYKTKIPCVGIITSKGYSQSKPEFGAVGNSWGSDGWMVNVDYMSLENVITPAHHMDSLAPLLPSKYAPLQANGRGLQGVYLAELPIDFGEKLIELIGGNISSILAFANTSKNSLSLDDDAAENRLVKLIQKRTDIPETEKERLIKARNGQGKFRDDVLAVHKSCPFTGITIEDLLKASHIKPWSRCNNEERLDPLNGLALTPTADHLFDKGYISFSREGQAIFSNTLNNFDWVSMGLNIDAQKYMITIHDDRQLAYIEFHRNNIFKRQGF